MKLGNFQKSKLFKYLSTYFAFVFIVLQVVDILSEPLSLPKNFIIYLLYFFAALLIFIVIFLLKGDKGSRSVTRTERISSSKFILPVSLSIILILPI